MATRISKVLRTKAAQKLEQAGFRFASTDRQIDNGTIAFAGIVDGRPTRYEITATGAVLSNKFVARSVRGDYPLEMYERGVRAAAQLLSKRLA